MTSWHSYPKIYNLGHRALRTLLDGEVTIQEKVDGSFFAFGVFLGQLKWRSKAIEMTTDKNFEPAVNAIKAVEHLLLPDHMYCGEYLRTPGHNTQTYARIPKNHIILFDIKRGDEDYLHPDWAKAEAERLGFEFVPYVMLPGCSLSNEVLHEYMQKGAILGGDRKPEGVVVKNYAQFGMDKKVLMGKHVSEAFKESHRVEWKVKNPLQGDILQSLREAYTTEARWQKGVGYLRDAGLLTDSPKDIGPLIKRIQQDVKEECEDAIKDALFKWAWPNIERSVVNGAPQWYKEKLLAKQFEQESEAS